MKHLNYNHLLYFNTVAREGSIARASETLHLTPQTISGQIKLLEEAVGAPLFDRVGRGLVLSKTGHSVNQYADAIFALGTELTQWVGGNQSGAAGTVTTGIVNSVPKMIAHRILQPVLEMEPPLRLACRENDLQSLLGELAVHRLDLILSDRPIPAQFSVKAYNHQLGESGIYFYGEDRLAERFGPGFPDSLEGAPVLLPSHGSALRRNLDAWFEEIYVSPKIVAEFDDSALLKVFGEAGAGLFPAPRVVEQELRHTYHVRPIGAAGSIKETYYAISPERVVKKPAVRRITDAARQSLASLT